MTDRQHLLTDEQIVQFISRGYIVLGNTIPPEQQRDILDKIGRVIKEEGNPGNNILPRVPEIQDLFESPIVRGALTSILGSDYYIHPTATVITTDRGR